MSAPKSAAAHATTTHSLVDEMNEKTSGNNIEQDFTSTESKEARRGANTAGDNSNKNNSKSRRGAGRVLSSAETTVAETRMRSSAHNHPHGDVDPLLSLAASHHTKSTTSTDITVAADVAVAERVVLFVRVEGEPYACLGELALVSCDMRVHPIRFVWALAQYDALVTGCNKDNFDRLLHAADSALG